ncbi:MAG TPA: twin-arginine translocase TatA/TatE family subunit [Allosphingosinicella sp.]|jgi:sec-independent protein translocase protein TatA
MGSFSIWHWLVVGIVLLLLFGKGRFSEMMGDVAKGIKNFKKGMTEEEEQEAARAAAAQRQIDARAAEPTVIQPQPTDIPAEPSATPSVTPAGSPVDGAQR